MQIAVIVLRVVADVVRTARTVHAVMQGVVSAGIAVRAVCVRHVARYVVVQHVGIAAGMDARVAVVSVVTV